MSSPKDKAIETLAKPLLNGAISYGAYRAFTPDFSTLTINNFGLNVKVPYSVATTLAGVGASVIAELLHNYILPQVADDRTAYVESRVLTPVLGAVSQLAVIGAMSTNALQRVNPVSIAAIGAGSEVLTQYAWDSFIKPMWYPDSAYNM